MNSSFSLGWHDLSAPVHCSFLLSFSAAIFHSQLKALVVPCIIGPLPSCVASTQLCRHAHRQASYRGWLMINAIIPVVWFMHDPYGGYSLSSSLAILWWSYFWLFSHLTLQQQYVCFANTDLTWLALDCLIFFVFYYICLNPKRLSLDIVIPFCSLIQGISYAHILFLHWWPREKVQHHCPTWMCIDFKDWFSCHNNCSIMAANQAAVLDFNDGSL